MVDFEIKTKQLMDSLKGICASYGLGNDGNEFKIITQVFLYKFLNDKFAFELKKINKDVANAGVKWEEAYISLSDDDKDMLRFELGAKTAFLNSEHLISTLFNRQNESDFAKLFDDTLRDIAKQNNDIFAVKTDGGTKITLFEQNGLKAEVNFTQEDIQSQSTGAITDNTIIAGIVNKYKNSFGKSRVVVIKSQLGQPITAYSGDKVYWKIPDNLPKMTKLMIDGKALYIHRANFQIIDKELLD